MARSENSRTSEGAGSLGLNLSGSHTVIRMSRGHSLYKLLQGDDRVHRPGQTEAVSYTDQTAVGPRGQRTVDYNVLVALAKKEDLANLTTSAWVRLVSEE